MSTERILILVIGCMVSFSTVGLSVLLMRGHLGTLLAGYNFKARGEKAVRCERYMLKRAGIILLVFSAMFFSFFLLLAFEINTAAYAMFGLSVSEIVIGVIVVNLNKKFKRAEFLAHKLTEDEDYEDELSQYDDF